MKKGNIFTKLLLLFTVVPVIEVFLLVKLAGVINWFWTIAIVIVTGVVGAHMAKKEGKGILSRIQMDLGAARIPKDDLINGLCVLIGGAFLITPGILTDIAGFSLILPFTRSVYRDMIKNKFKNMVSSGSVSYIDVDFTEN